MTTAEIGHGGLDIIITELNLDNCGTWKNLANGDQVWQLVLTCEQALTVNRFTNTEIPEGNEHRL